MELLILIDTTLEEGKVVISVLDDFHPKLGERLVVLNQPTEAGTGYLLHDIRCTD